MATLKELFQRHGLKQKDVADALGIAEETLSRWVQGHVKPSGENLVRLYTYLRKYEPKLRIESLSPEPEAEAAR